MRSIPLYTALFAVQKAVSETNGGVECPDREQRLNTNKRHVLGESKARFGARRGAAGRVRVGEHVLGTLASLDIALALKRRERQDLRARTCARTRKRVSIARGYRHEGRCHFENCAPTLIDCESTRAEGTAVRGQARGAPEERNWRRPRRAFSAESKFSCEPPFSFLWHAGWQCGPHS